jgi:DNA-binding Lrp family transcriptional regulator
LLTAFLLVITEKGSPKKVLRLLETIEAVEEVYSVCGTYDIVVKIKTRNIAELNKIITGHLIRSNDVRSTSTMIILPEKTIGKLPKKAPTIARIAKSG